MRFFDPVVAITTDGLRSYGAAMNELGTRDKQEIGRWAYISSKCHRQWRKPRIRLTR